MCDNYYAKADTFCDRILITQGDSACHYNTLQNGRKFMSSASQPINGDQGRGEAVREYSITRTGGDVIFFQVMTDPAEV